MNVFSFFLLPHFLLQKLLISGQSRKKVPAFHFATQTVSHLNDHDEAGKALTSSKPSRAGSDGSVDLTKGHGCLGTNLSTLLAVEF